MEIARQGGKKIIPSKLKFDHQNYENKEEKNKREESDSQGSREANTLKLDKWDSMQYLIANCKCFIIHVADEHIAKSYLPFVLFSNFYYINNEVDGTCYASIMNCI